MIRIVKYMSRSGLPVAAAQTEAREVQLSSRYDPETQASNWVAKMVTGNECVIVLIGYAGPYVVNALLAQAPQATVLVLHPDEATLTMFSEAGISNWNQPERVRCMIGEPADVRAALRETLQKFYTPIAQHRFCVLEDAGCCNVYPAYMAEIRRSVMEVIHTTLMAFQTALSVPRAGLYHTLVNLPRYCAAAPFSCLDGAAKGGAAVIAGAGPSLGHHMAWLKQHRERLVLIACDTAVSPLHQAGLKPDLVVCVDLTDQNAAHFELFWDWLSDVPLVLTSHCSPLVFQRYLGPLIVFQHENLTFWGESGFGKKGSLPFSAVNVGFAAMNVAIVLGSALNFIMGIDLAFDQGQAYSGATQAKSSIIEKPNGQKVLRKVSKDGTIKDSQVMDARRSDGSVAVTSDILLTYKVFLENFREWIENRFYNMSQIGLELEGVPFIDRTSAEALLSNTAQATAACLSRTVRSKQVVNWQYGMNKMLRQLKKELKAHQKCAAEGLAVLGDTPLTEARFQQALVFQARIQENTNLNKVLDPLIKADLYVLSQANPNRSTLAEKAELSAGLFTAISSAADLIFAAMEKAESQWDVT